MSWLMPVPIRWSAGTGGRVAAAVQADVSHVWLFVDVLIIGMGTGAACAAARAVYWWIEQRR